MPIRRPDTPRLQWVKFTRAKGKLYAYFNTGRKVNGKIVYQPLPEFGTAEFYLSYGAFKGARTKRAKIAADLSSIADLYQRSDQWRNLSEGTQKIYRYAIGLIMPEFGEFPLDDIRRGDIIRVVEEIPGGAKRNIFVSVMGVLFKFARFRDLTTNDPCKDIPKYATGEHEPWPTELLEAALKSDDQFVRLATHLLYFTGQRIGDVAKMRWSDVRGDRIEVTPQKTARLGKHLKIHQHHDLARELANTPKLGLAIIAKPDGKPWTAQTIRDRLQAFAKDHGYSVVPHGLRKSAVIALLEAGCTIPEVQSVTGQSVEMVMHYAARVDQGKLSEAAILKLERKR